MDIKEAAHIDAAEHSDTAGSTVRRRILAAGLSATALSLVPTLARRAGATGRSAATSGTGPDQSFTGQNGSSDTLGGTPSIAPNVSTGGSSDAGATIGTNGGFNGTGDSTNASSDVTIGATGDTTSGSTGDSVAATTTTAPPKRPTDEDVTLLTFAQSFELTIRNLYDVAIDLGAFNGPALEAIKAIRESHEAYGQSLSGLLGRRASNKGIDELFKAMVADFSGTAEQVATAAQALENTAVATHIDIVGKLVGVDGAALVASMLIVEARHATVLSTVAGVAEISKQIATAGTALSPSDYSTK